MGPDKVHHSFLGAPAGAASADNEGESKPKPRSRYIYLNQAHALGWEIRTNNHLFQPSSYKFTCRSLIRRSSRKAKQQMQNAAEDCNVQ